MWDYRKYLLHTHRASAHKHQVSPSDEGDMKICNPSQLENIFSPQLLVCHFSYQIGKD